MPRMFRHVSPIEKLAEKYLDGVRFTDDGYRDFFPYAIHTVTIDPNFKATGRRTSPEPAGWPVCLEPPSATPGTITQLMPRDLHRAVRHAGGAAMMKNRRYQHDCRVPPQGTTRARTQDRGTGTAAWAPAA